MARRLNYNDVVLATPVSVPYERFSDRTAHYWIGRALRLLLERSGFEKAAIDGLSVASFSLGSDSAVALTQHFGFCTRWLDHVPMGGASGIVSLRRAARAVQSGDADVVACVAGDTNPRDGFRDLVRNFSRFSQDAVYPYGAAGPNGSFAFLTDHYMRKFGATREDFGKISVSQRENALLYPHALMKKPLSLEDYLNSRMIADPICLFDCVMPCAGAEAFLVMREETALAQGLQYVHLRSAIERHNAFSDDPVQERGGWALDREELWAMACCSPAEIDLVQTYDDYPVIVMMQLEDLGFCQKGEAKDFVRSHSMTVDGDFPHNTSGGQLSVGQAGAAGGHLGIVETLRQLTGASLDNQVKDARRALISGFGMINYDRGLCSGAAILEGQGA